jgi:membrane protease YdiL (CAAX protease family)
MPGSVREARTSVQTFLVCTFSLSAMFYLLMMQAGKVDAMGGLYRFGLMWSPAAGALAALYARRGSIESLGWKWNFEEQRESILIPLAYASGAYAIIWLLGIVAYPNYDFIDKLVTDLYLDDYPRIAAVLEYLAVVCTVGLVQAAASVLGEEIGWRGFLVPELFKLESFTRTALASGLLWALWALPLMLLTQHELGTIDWLSIGYRTVMMIAIAVALAWLRLRSGSVWSTVTFHACHSVLVQAILTPLTIVPPTGRIMVGEYGPALAITTTIVAVVVWRRGLALDKRRTGSRHVSAGQFHDVILRTTAPLPSRHGGEPVVLRGVAHRR